MDVLVFGGINSDLSLRVGSFPHPGETVIASATKAVLGGKGANQAFAAARLGAATAMVGAVGDDERGRGLRDGLAAAGVDVERVRTLKGESGLAVVLVDAAGENIIAVAPGANHLAAPEGLTFADGMGPAIMLAQLECGLDAVERFLRAGAGVRHRILNAAPYVVGAGALFDLVDIIVVNEVELSRYAGLRPGHDQDIANAARGLMTRDDQSVIVTLGAKGALVVSRLAVTPVAGRPAMVVDTTGAGDCFCGALAAFLARDPTIGRAVRFAVTAASLAVERPGATSAMPDLAELALLVD